MNLVILEETVDVFTTEQREFIEKTIHTALFLSGFFSRYIRDVEFQEKRQNDKVVDQIATIIIDNFHDRTDERGDTYKYCLRDVSHSDLGRVIVGILHECNADIFKNDLKLRLALRNALYQCDTRLSTSLDEFFPLTQR